MTKAGNATRFVYDGDQLSVEYDAAGNILRRYVHGDGDDDPLVWYEGSTTTAPRYLYADHQGSIIAAVVQSGIGTLLPTVQAAYRSHDYGGANPPGDS